MLAALVENALLDRVTIDFAGELPPELAAVSVDILGQRLLKDCPAQQLRLGIAGQITQLLVDAQYMAGFVNLGYSCADMLIAGGKPRVARPNPIFRAGVERLRTAG